MGLLRPLDWEAFLHYDRLQPLRIIASSCKDLSTLVFDSKSCNSFESFLACIRASMAVPGITGDLMAMKLSEQLPFRYTASHLLEYADRNHEVVTIADAFLTEPIPFRPAVRDNCTHIIVLRTRPDPSPTLGKSNWSHESF